LGLVSEGALGPVLQVMVPAMVAALIEGQAFVRKNGALPGSGRKWVFAGIATVLGCFLALGLAHAPPTVAPVFSKMSMVLPGASHSVVVLGFYVGGYLLVNRIFYGLGAGNTMSRIKAREDTKL